MFIGFFVTGIILGIVYASQGEMFSMTFTELIFFYVFLLVSFFLTINIHELGHYVFGRRLGFKLLMYKVGWLTFTKENDRFKFKLEKNKGYSGFCAMLPNENTNMLDKRLIWYYGGGILFNFLSAIFMWFILSAIELVILRQFIVVFIGISLILGFVNLIPFKSMGNMRTDGVYIFGILRSDQDTLALLKSQNITIQLISGIRPAALDFSEVVDEDSIETYMLYYYQALDQMDLLLIRERIDVLTSREDELGAVFLPGLYHEAITAGVLLGDNELVQTYRAKDRHLEKDNDLNGLRVKAYLSYFDNDFEKATQCIQQAFDVEDKFPLLGQRVMEASLLKQLQEKITESVEAAV